MINLTFIDTGTEGLDLIQPLWEKLNEHHRKKKTDFQNHYENFTFQERKEVLLGKALGGDMRVDLAEERESELLVGYCVTTISSENEGEIDSIYVHEKYRSLGIGDKLMERSLDWLEKKGIKNKKVVVAAGNQEAISFYERYGFRHRFTTLEHINKEKDNYI